MGRKYAGEIATKLIAAGRAPEEPAALVSSASFRNQDVRETSLAKLGEVAAESNAPAILVIGEIVRLRAGMDWLGAIAGRKLEPDPLGASRLRDVS
jgi:uroporphyrin-III C-methyltransferase